MLHVPWAKRRPKVSLLLLTASLSLFLAGSMAWILGTSDRHGPTVVSLSADTQPSVHYIARPPIQMPLIGAAIGADHGTGAMASGTALSSELPQLHTVLGQSSYALGNLELFLDPEAGQRLAPASWQSNRPQDADTLQRLAAIPSAIWFGDWNTDIRADAQARLAAQAPDQVAVVVAYNIPQRDCGQYSAGGATDANTYRAWIDQLAHGMGQHKAIVILEPDALAGIDCLSTADQARRYDLLRYAVTTLTSRPNIWLYLDAGNSQWQSVSVMADRLRHAGISQARGFSLNVSNFLSTQSETDYGQQLSTSTAGKHFVIDTSRNGLGPTPDYAWCNPPGRAVGHRPTLSTELTLVDAYLWIKNPGESDGQCHGSPAAGVWWPEYALGLAQRGGV